MSTINNQDSQMILIAVPLFRSGHIPVVGEWLALPLVQLAGSKAVGDEPFNEIFHPIAVRLLQKCDGILRVGGPSQGADEMVRVGRELGLRIYSRLEDVSGIPGLRRSALTRAPLRTHLLTRVAR